MEWMLSVSDHIVELVPSWQRYPDGSTMEVRESCGPDRVFPFQASHLNGTYLEILLGSSYHATCACHCTLRIDLEHNTI